MNNDLISRSTLIDSLYEHEFQIFCPLDDVSTVIDAEPAVDAVLAVDAEPVRHGKWVYDPNANDWGIGGYICSECHVKNNNLPCSNVANPMIFVGTKYCPNCGAKMDLEDDE